MSGSGSESGAQWEVPEYEVAEIPQVSIGGGTASGGYTVDPERAPRLIQALEDARAKLYELQSLHRDLDYVSPPDGDPYSIAAAEAIRRRLGDEPGGYAYANRAATDQLTTLIEKLKASLKAYQDTEKRNRDTIKRKGM
ncbi:hypothetical protein ACFFQA_11810 [Allokutzneria oryzae]|uniref:PE domain-containing protein n=1 Tax=Allokutzneria oryzae TaxID=1378989 RepID=A0ABV5ZUQ3_9PSEU